MMIRRRESGRDNDNYGHLTDDEVVRYLRGETTTDEELRVEQHLTVCSDCIGRLKRAGEAGRVA